MLVSLSSDANRWIKYCKNRAVLTAKNRSSHELYIDPSIGPGLPNLRRTDRVYTLGYFVYSERTAQSLVD